MNVFLNIAGIALAVFLGLLLLISLLSLICMIFNIVFDEAKENFKNRPKRKRKHELEKRLSNDLEMIEWYLKELKDTKEETVIISDTTPSVTANGEDYLIYENGEWKLQHGQGMTWEERFWEQQKVLETYVQTFYNYFKDNGMEYLYNYLLDKQREKL